MLIRPRPEQLVSVPIDVLVFHGDHPKRPARNRIVSPARGPHAHSDSPREVMLSIGAAADGRAGPVSVDACPDRNLRHCWSPMRGPGADPRAIALTPSRPPLRAYDEPKLGASGPFRHVRWNGKRASLACVFESRIAVPPRSWAMLRDCCEAW